MVKKITATVVCNFLSLIVAGLIVSGFIVGDLWTAAIGAIVFSVINFIIKPLIKLIALPITLVTFGLFTFIINTGMVYLLAWITDINVTSFWSALIASIIISIVNIVTGWFIKDDK